MFTALILYVVTVQHCSYLYFLFMALYFCVFIYVLCYGFSVNSYCHKDALYKILAMQFLSAATLAT